MSSNMLEWKPWDFTATCCHILSSPTLWCPVMNTNDALTIAPLPPPPFVSLLSLHNLTHVYVDTDVDCLCSNSTVSPQKQLPYQPCSQALVSLLEDWQIWHQLRAAHSAPLCIWEAPTSWYSWGYAHQNRGNSILQGNHLFHDTAVLNWKLKLKVLV